jgi:hypothetical protein
MVRTLIEASGTVTYAYTAFGDLHVQTGNTPEDAALIQTHRSRIETVNSQLEKMELQRFHARTNPGFALKVLASLLTLTFTKVI